MKFADIILILNEQTDNWLYNWFKNVPEEKITKTFVKTTFVMPTMNQILNGDFNFYKKQSYSKQDILKVISASTVVKVPYNQFVSMMLSDAEIAMKSKIPLASYIDSEAGVFIPKMTSELNKTFARLTKSINQTTDPKLKKEYESQINSAKRELKRLQLLGKYSGKVVMPDNITDTIKRSGLDVDAAVSHEKMHNVYDATKESADDLIARICTSKKCMYDDGGYYKKETEIYSYLFTIRQKMKLQPTDVIESVKLEKGPVNSVINIIVNRGGKRILLKDSLPAKSATIKAMECCTGSFEKSLKDLHNTLAMNNNTNNSNLI